MLTPVLRLDGPALLFGGSLAPGYRLALGSGSWPSEDVLPNAERACRGEPLRAVEHRW